MPMFRLLTITKELNFIFKIYNPFTLLHLSKPRCTMLYNTGKVWLSGRLDYNKTGINMAVIREDNSNTQQALLFPPAKVEATQDAIVAIDVSGWESVLFSAILGASDVNLAGNNSIQIELQHSDNNVDFEACNDRDLVDSTVGLNAGTLANIDAEIPAEGLSFKAAYKGHKRYVRPIIRCTGGDHGNNNHGTMVGISALLRGTKYPPTTN